jgi:hypothetical protein
MRRWHISLNQDYVGFGDYALRIAWKDERDNVHCVTNAIVETVPVGSALPVGQMMTLPSEACQLLIDELHRLGFRPTQAKSVQTDQEWLQSQLAKFIDMATR